MEAIVVIMLISLTVALGFLVSFLVTVRSGQYQDMVEPSIAMLLDNNITLVNEIDANHQTPSIDNTISVSEKSPPSHNL